MGNECKGCKALGYAECVCKLRCEYCAEDVTKLLKVYDVPGDTWLWMCEKCAMKLAIERARG